MSLDTGLTASAQSSDKQCWECLRRGWSCDAALPVCNKCRAAGIVCPGYGNAKPLVWLAPGRVTSRARKTKTATYTSSFPSSSSATTAKASSSALKKPDVTNCKPSRRRASQLSRHPITTNGAEDGSATIQLHPSPAKTFQPLACKEARFQSPVKIKQDEDASSDTSIEVVPRDFTPFPEPPLLSTLIRTELNKEWWEIVDVAKYFNGEVYPELASLNLGGPSSLYVVPFDVKRPRAQSAHHSVVAMILQHRLIASSQLHGSLIEPRQSDLQLNPVSTLRWRLHYHTGMALRYLVEELNDEGTRYSDETLRSIIAIFLLIVNSSPVPQWKPHLNGLMSLLIHRGGLGKVLTTSKSNEMMATLNYLLIITILGNTTSAADMQLTPVQHYKVLHLISRLYSIAFYPEFPCAPDLFLEIVRINYLRFRIATEPSVAAEESSSSTKTQTILKRLLAADPQELVETSNMKRREESVILTEIFRLTILLYALGSLPTGFCGKKDMYINEESCRSKLITLLRQWRSNFVIKTCMLWSLIILGVVTTEEYPEDRLFIRKCLVDKSKSSGGPVDYFISLLDKFWDSGETEWDKCFTDLSYVVI